MGADLTGAYGLPIPPEVASTLSIEEINRLTQEGFGPSPEESAAIYAAAQALRAEQKRLEQYAANQQALRDYNNAVAAQDQGFWGDLAEGYVSTVDTILDIGADAPATIVETAFETGTGIGAEVEDIVTGTVAATAQPISALADPVSAVADPLFDNIEKIAIPLAVVGGAYLLLKG
jgi:hypothetical protein